MNTKKILILFFIASFFILASCASKKKIVYMQNADSSLGKSEKLFETKLQPDDLLLIHVSSKDLESSTPFNLEILMVPPAGTGAAQRQQQFYIVDNEGFIQFPVLGKIKLGGLTRSQAISLFTTKLSDYLQEPIINLRIMNFKISVLGEVQRPGTYNIPSERITLLDAISMASDLTIYGQRNNILVIREVEGKKTTQRVDLTSSDFINSDFYYLKQNDVVYIEPNKTKVNTSVIGPNVTVGLSVFSLLITIIALTLK